MQREEKSKILESKRLNSKKGSKSITLEGENQKSQVQSSSSAPTLEKKNDTMGPSLRETSSWSNPSDSTRISQRKNVHFNIVDAMNPIGDQMKKKKECRNEICLDKLREEFWRLIVPLMQRVVSDNPSDLVAYCAQYFQELLTLREGKNKISNSKRLDGSVERSEEEYQKDRSQNSSNLPTLYQMNNSSGPLLFENVSLNDKLGASWRMQQKSNVRAADKKITHPMDKKGDDDSLKEVKAKETEDASKYGERTKEKGDHFNDKKRCTEVGKITSDSPLLPQPSNHRRKWSEPDKLDNKISRSPIFSGTSSSSSDSDEFDASYVMFQNEETIPLNLTVHDSVSDSYKPRFHSAGESSRPKDIPGIKGKNSSNEKTELTVDEVESLAQSLFQKLKQSIQLAEEELKGKIQQLQISKGNASMKSQSQIQPRKKRSITTLDSAFKERDKDSMASYCGSDRDMQKAKEAENARKNHQRKDGASEHVQQSNAERSKEERYKNRNSNFSKQEGLTNPAFSMDQQEIRPFKSTFLRPSKPERNMQSATDSTQQPRSVRVPTIFPSIRPVCLVPTYPPSSHPTVTSSIISNIGDGDVPPPHQNVCSIGIETDNQTAVERCGLTALHEARNRSYRNYDSKHSRDASKKEKGGNKASKKGENNENGSTKSKENCSMALEKEKTDTKEPKEGQLEKSQSAAEEINPVSKDEAKKNDLEKKLSEHDLERVKSSNLNPCAPVFSPNSTRLASRTDQATNASTSTEGRKKWDQATRSRSDHAFLTNSDLLTDAVAWDCLKFQHIQALENVGPQRNINDGRVQQQPTLNGIESSGSRTNHYLNDPHETLPNQPENRDKKGGSTGEINLNPACGDFVLSEDNEDKPLQNGTADENSTALSSPEYDDAKDKVEELKQLSGEEELNFACLSDDSGGSSGSYTSELSEEEYREEN